LVFTNSKGEFFLRTRRPERFALTVSLDEFLLPGQWEVVTAPAEVKAEPEEGGSGVEVVLRHGQQ
jgi:hypothetical protein